MKYFRLILLFIVFSSLLEASYLRTIRIASYKSEISANKTFDIFRKSAEYKEILNLEENSDYNIVLVNTGKHYVLQIEPLTSIAQVKDIEKIIKKKYPDAYIRKMSKEELVKKEKIEPFIKKVEFEKTPRLEEELTVIEPIKTVKVVRVEVPVEIIKEVPVIKEVKVLVKEKDLWIWQVLLIIVFCSFLITLIILFSYKKENARLRELAIKIKEEPKFDDLDDIDLEDFEFNLDEYDELDTEFSKKIK